MVLAVLMVHGERDVTCPANVAKEAMEGMSSKDKTLVLISAAKHDLELDLWREEWFAYVSEWMNRQVAKAQQLSGCDEANPASAKEYAHAFTNEIMV